MSEGNKLSQTMRIKIDADSDAPVTRRMPSIRARSFSTRLPVKARLSPAENTLYQQFMKSIYDAVLITDPQGALVDANGRAYEFFHYDLDELCEKTIFDIVCGFNAVVLGTIISNLKNERFTLIEACCRRQDETLFHAEIATSLLHLGQAPHLCFFVRDISKRKQDEADLAQTRAQLDRAERLEMAGSIAGHIAHDFNNLLTPLLAYPHFIREALPPGAQCRQDLDIIEKTAQQIADINQQLLALSRRGYYEQRVLDINAVIENVMVLLKRGGQMDGVNVDLRLEKNLLHIKGSSEQLLRVIHNLCQNALDAMDQRKHLTIATEQVYLEAPLKKYESVDQGEYIKVTVADTGHGIPPEIQDKIFDPFFTTKEATRQRGSGLGLSVVHGIVKDHQGYIDLESAVGRGAAFSLYFPVCREELTEASVKECTGGEETILVVDDDRLQIEVTTRILSKLGYQVLSANSGEEALELMRRRKQAGQLPDLAVLDMIMGGGIDGTETYRQMKEINPSQRAIIFSGYAESARVGMAQELGAGAYLRKPVSLDKLAQAVRYELDRQA